MEPPPTQPAADAASDADVRNEAALVPAEQHAAHPWFDPAATYWSGKELPENARAAVEATIARGHTSREQLLAVLPQSDRLHAGCAAPVPPVFALDGTPLSLADVLAPVTVLNFGSYTWPPFRAKFARIEELARKHTDVRFVAVYILEAHPVDGWQLPVNEDTGVCYRKPKTTAQRCTIARHFKRDFNVSMEMVVDGIDNAAELAYEARPERLYVIRDGVVAWRTGWGPYCYDEEALAQYLADMPPAPPLSS